MESKLLFTPGARVATTKLAKPLFPIPALLPGWSESYHWKQSHCVRAANSLGGHLDFLMLA